MTSGSTGWLSSRLPWNSIQLMRATTLSVSRRNSGPAGSGEGADGLEMVNLRDGKLSWVVFTRVQGLPLISSIGEWSGPHRRSGCGYAVAGNSPYKRQVRPA